MVQTILTQLSSDYGLIIETVEEQKRLSEIEILLKEYPNCLEIWLKSRSYFLSFDYRECLDNARLCLELLLKKILGNTKSLEINDKN